MNEPIYVTKASGELVPFEVGKLRHSLSNAGASSQIIEQIVAEVLSDIYPSISTKKIYQKAFSLLKKQHRPAAVRYNLKKAIMELGPSGYPFERFVGEILKHEGYDVEVGVMEKGHCIMHEIDVLAEKDNQRIMVECKFGNKAGKKVTSKVSLYIHSRFRDLAREWGRTPVHSQKEYKGWVVTNGSFTDEAIKYGVCAGLHLIGWDFPKQGSLKQLIDICHLYPVTALTAITKAEKQRLLEREIVLCRELDGREDILHEIHVPPSRIRKALNEIRHVCVE